MEKIDFEVIYNIVYGPIVFFLTINCVISEYRYSFNDLYPSGKHTPKYYLLLNDYIHNILKNILFLIGIGFIVGFMSYIVVTVYIINMVILGFYLDKKTTHNLVTHVNEKTPIFISMIIFAPVFLLFPNKLIDIRKFSYIKTALVYYEQELNKRNISSTNRKEYESKQISCSRQLKLRKIRKNSKNKIWKIFTSK